MYLKFEDTRGITPGVTSTPELKPISLPIARVGEVCLFQKVQCPEETSSRNVI